MSSIKLESNASGTGIFTIVSPNSNTNRTLSIPDATGTINTSGAVNEVPAGSASAPSITTTGDTNTGIFFPAADTIGFVCGGTEDFRVDGDGQLWNTVNSQVGTDYTTLYKGYLCRAWVNFNGTGTPAIRASGNVSSITDNNTGNYTVNFTTALPDANYAVVSGITESGVGGQSRVAVGDGVTTSSSLVLTYNSATLTDYLFIQVAYFR